VVKKAGKMYQNHPAKATETDSILAQCGNQEGDTGEAEEALAEYRRAFLTNGGT
jgi:hypothetical protein